MVAEIDEAGGGGVAGRCRVEGGAVLCLPLFSDEGRRLVKLSYLSSATFVVDSMRGLMHKVVLLAVIGGEGALRGEVKGEAWVGGVSRRVEDESTSL